MYENWIITPAESDNISLDETQKSDILADIDSVFPPIFANETETDSEELPFIENTIDPSYEIPTTVIPLDDTSPNYPARHFPLANLVDYLIENSYEVAGPIEWRNGKPFLPIRDCAF